MGNRPRLAIVRTSGRPIRSDFYNIQEIGLAKALATCGWQCDVFMASSTGKLHIQEPFPEVRVINLPCWTFLGDQGVFPSLLPTLRTGKYDAIQVQEHWQFSSALVSRGVKHLGIPIILGQGKYKDNRGLRRLQIILTDQFLVPILRRNITHVLCKTQSAESYIHKKGFKLSTVLPIGLDDERFKDFQSCEKTNIRENVNLLYVGYMRKPRNIPFMLRLVEHLAERNVPVCLRLIGNGPDLELCKDMLSKNRLIVDNVVLLDRMPQSQLSEYYANAHFFLLPTESDIYGMVIIESMYFGTPTIATKVAGPNSIITQGKDGFLVDGFDVASWAELIQNCRTKPDTYAKLSTTAAQQARQQFTWSALGPKYSQFYSSLL